MKKMLLLPILLIAGCTKPDIKITTPESVVEKRIFEHEKRFFQNALIPIEEAIPYLEMGYNALDAKYLCKAKIPHEKAMKYKRLDLNVVTIIEIEAGLVTLDSIQPYINQGFDGSTATLLVHDKLSSESALPYYKKGIRGIALLDAAKHKPKFESIDDFIEQSYTIQESALLASHNIPLQYALDSYLPIMLTIDIFHSQLRDSTISKSVTRDVYGDNMVYKDYSELEMNTLDVEIPYDLACYMSSMVQKERINNTAGFNELTLYEAGQLNLSSKDIAIMSPKDSIKLMLTIIKRRMTWVDIDKETFPEKGIILSDDECYFQGRGDCDKYAGIAQGIFTFFKSLNPSLKNIYLTAPIGRNKNYNHDWVSIIILHNDKIICSHIDPTFYDSQGTLEAGPKHLEKANFTENFYRDLNEHMKHRLF